MRAARSAGKYPASSATAANTTIIAANVSGSVAVTPYNKEAANRVASNAPTNPIAAPSPAKRIVSPKINCRTVAGDAPSAMRIPISVLRWLTEYEITA